MRINDALRIAAGKLHQQGIANPWHEAKLLLAGALNQEILYLVCNDHLELPADDLNKFQELLERRLKGEPYAYISGRRYFMYWEFKVSPAVLIPRPETEILVELAAKLVQVRFSGAGLLADVGTGSGVIGLSLLAMLPGIRLHAVDISQSALAVARDNALRLGVSDRVDFHQGDLLQPLSHWQGQYHCITANLPYIPESEYPFLQPEVHQEPKAALIAGSDGLECYRRFLPGIGRWLAPGGIVLLETGETQAEAVGNMLAADGINPFTVKDLSGKDRIVWGEKPT